MGPDEAHPLIFDDTLFILANHHRVLLQRCHHSNVFQTSWQRQKISLTFKNADRHRPSCHKPIRRSGIRVTFICPHWKEFRWLTWAITISHPLKITAYFRLDHESLICSASWIVWSKRAATNWSHVFRKKLSSASCFPQFIFKNNMGRCLNFPVFLFRGTGSAI